MRTDRWRGRSRIGEFREVRCGDRPVRSAAPHIGSRELNVPAYIFHTLSPADFEELCRDLLGASLGLRLQSFLPGPDGGVDLLHASHEGDTVVQCKHYLKSGYNELRRTMEREELPKIERLAAKRYVLCTSVGLTRARKDELVKILHPYVLSSDDIVGQEDLNALLREHPQVEKRHYKLWLTSTALLEKILHNGLAVWNDMERADIERKLCLYVHTGAYDSAREILDEHHCVVISGIPGIGKTTLAQILVTHLLDRDYELVAARGDVQQAIEGFDATRKQVIYYDDFLGRSSFADRLEKNEEQGLLRLFSEAAKSPNKRVVMTTREYVLQEARQHYELLSGPELDITKCIVEVESYTRAMKARILYNHLFFSDLPEEYVASLMTHRSYRSIVDHENYSPRVVEWMTTALGTAGASAIDYPKLFMENLDNPARVWSHAFETQICPAARVLLLVLGTLPENTDIGALERAWHAAGDAGISAGPGEAHLRFISAIRQLDGSFLQTTRLGRDRAVSFHNASVRDFVLQRIGADGALARELLANVVYFEQILTLVQLGADGKIQENVAGLVPDDELLLTAVGRTIQSPQALLVHASFRYGGGQLFWRTTASIGVRMSKAARWTLGHYRNGFLQHLVALILKLEEEGALPGGKPVAFTEFLDILISASGVDEEARGRVVDILVRHINAALDEYSDTSDWTTWGNFVKKHISRLLTLDWSELQGRVITYCESEADTVVDNADSSYDISSDCDDLGALAEAWEVEIDDTLAYLDQCAEEKFSDELEEDDEPYEGPSSPAVSSGDTDQEIDRLFQSLGCKAE